MELTESQLNAPLILIIDDDECTRIQSRQVLEQAGYQVAEASDYEQGLADAHHLHPDVVLLKLLMSKTDGFNLCTQLQNLFAGERIPILAIIGLEDQQSVERALAAGATDFITQPIHSILLQQRVHRLLQENQAIKQLRQQTERALKSEAQLQLALAEVQWQNRRTQIFADVTLKIRQSLKLDEVLHTTVTEVQQLLQADRVLIFRLQQDGFGQIVTEAVVPEFLSVLGQNIKDDCFGPEYLKKYRQGRIYTIDNIEAARVEACLADFMRQFQIKAKLVMPILLQEELWGLLIAHQCHSPRHWTNFEIELLRQLADQVSIALAQAHLLEQETQRRQELARSNTELEQFAYIASHDLQEPLRKIQAFSDRLKEKCSQALSQQGADYLERIQTAAERMQNLINDLLTLSRVMTKAQLIVSVDLAQVVQDVLCDLELQIQRTQAQIFVSKLPIIEAEPLQMYQLFQNLISNALKFRLPTKPPIIKVYSENLVGQRLRSESGALISELCQIIVEDDGIGFDEKYLDRIFNVFQRLHSRSEYEGTGMGLAICRKIAERHGGSITAQSTPGRGAKFIVTLPLKQPKGASE